MANLVNTESSGRRNGSVVTRPSGSGLVGDELGSETVRRVAEHSMNDARHVDSSGWRSGSDVVDPNGFDRLGNELGVGGARRVLSAFSRFGEDVVRRESGLDEARGELGGWSSGDELGGCCIELGASPVMAGADLVGEEVDELDGSDESELGVERADCVIAEPNRNQGVVELGLGKSQQVRFGHDGARQGVDPVALFGKGKNLDAILNAELGGLDPMDDRDFRGYNDFGVGATCFYDCENDGNVGFDEHDKEFSESGGLGRLLIKNGFGHLVAKSHDAATGSGIGIEVGSKIEERCFGKAPLLEDAIVPLDHGPSICDTDSLKDMLSLCGAPKEIELLKPSLLQRPWTPPEGYICLYEAFFTHCGLMFPLPEFLTEYCARRILPIYR
ncbi:unnamed protein product [Arabidopsis halleri]